MKFNLLYTHKSQELLTWYDTITKQIYFTNINNIIIHNDGLNKLLYLVAFYLKSSYNTQNLYTSHI